MVVFCLWFGVWPKVVGAVQQASLVVHFSSGRALLGSAEKNQLRQFFQSYEVVPRSRVFVVGYADAQGDKYRNFELSRKRAQNIRREIIRAFGLSADAVMAVAKGEQNPVADNHRLTGRASNRRAEIFLVNAEIRRPARVYGPEDPYLPDIRALIQEARVLIKQRQLDQAIKILRKASSLGGDHYADWHAAYGIAVFYANAPADETNAHLVTALQLDPYHREARDYLSRLTARQKVVRGEVTPEMGLSVDNPIRVTAKAQQYEYLQLFKAVPLVHRALEGRPVVVWECVDAQGAAVRYYFDHTHIHDWLFAQQKPQSDANDSRSIWNSKIFK